jgi:hypothetical protein
MAVDAGDFEPVLQRLSDEARERFNAPTVSLTPLERLSRPFSQLLIVRAATPSRHIDLYVKRIRPTGSEPDATALVLRRLKREYDGAAAAYNAVRGHAGLYAVRPVALYPDLLAIVTERLPGRTLRHVLSRDAVWWASPGASRRLGSMVAGVARWLQMYQNRELSRERASLADLRSYLDIRLRALAARRFLGIAERDRDALLDYFDARAAAVTPEMLGVARAHGDLNPENILVDGDRVGLVDFSMIKVGPRLLDVTHLYMCFELMRWRPWYRPSLLRDLQRRLLGEYDPTLAPGDPLFEVLALQHAVARLTGLPDTVTTTAAAIRRWILRRREVACRGLVPLPSR